ncbi:stage III sporulation protein AF [Salibacterium sp. K-3]
MDIFHEWMSHLIIFLLAAFLLELLLPSSSFQKYARLVLSFILMLLIIEPLIEITSLDAEQKVKQTMNEWRKEAFQVGSMESEIDQQKNEIESGQDAYISQQVSRRLLEEVEEGVQEQWGWEVESVSTETSGDNGAEGPLSVRVVLRDKSEERKQESGGIEPVRIHVDSDETDDAGKKQGSLNDIRTYLAETWEMQEERIDISIVEEGDRGG